MSSAKSFQQFYVGWDVGGWHCDTNGKSRDAIVILNDMRTIVGKPWRGSLREEINKAATTDAWIQALFKLCAAEAAYTSPHVYMAIDTPLGFSEAFIDLISQLKAAKTPEAWTANPDLFRATERILFERGARPLSAVQGMIGSQATKGMHVLAKFARDVESCGVWKGGNSLTVLEAYPGACRKSATINRLRRTRRSLGHKDKDDALICALIANLFAEQRDLLAAPEQDIPAREGWIWVPKDCFRPDKQPTAKGRRP